MHLSAVLNETLNKNIDDLRSPKAELRTQFRFDDNDAAGLEFVEDIRTLTEKSKKLFEFGRKMAVVFSTGFAVKPSDADLRAALLDSHIGRTMLASSCVLIPNEAF